MEKKENNFHSPYFSLRSAIASFGKGKKGQAHYPRTAGRDCNCGGEGVKMNISIEKNYCASTEIRRLILSWPGRGITKRYKI